MGRKRFKPRPDHPRCPVTGKLKYSSMQTAERAMAQALLHGSGLQIPCRVYECKHEGCGGWHTTKQPRRYAPEEDDD